MRLLLLTLGLGLLSVVPAASPPLNPAHPEELEGDWFVVRWAGNMPIPEETKMHAVPPFTLTKNEHRLEFKANVMRPIGCVEFKLPLYAEAEPGIFQTQWKHTINAYFVPGKGHAIAYFSGYMNYMSYQMMMLMAHTLDEDPHSLRIFKEFVESKKLTAHDIINPIRADPCELPRDS